MLCFCFFFFISFCCCVFFCLYLHFDLHSIGDWDENENAISMALCLYLSTAIDNQCEWAVKYILSIHIAPIATRSYRVDIRAQWKYPCSKYSTLMNELRIAMCYHFIISASIRFYGKLLNISTGYPKAALTLVLLLGATFHRRSTATVLDT